MTTHRTFYLVPADVVAQPTIAIPRPLAPSPRIAPATTPRLQKPALKRPPLCADPIEVLLGETPQPHQRKRECLDHLTHEQKMNRRKMKNRIAAQTARDRKKYRSQRLEDVIRELLEQNEILKQENELLRIENRELSEQNSSLMSRLSPPGDVQCQMNPSQSTIVYDEVHEMVTEKSGAALESAAFISGPQPREQVVPLYLLFHLMISLLLVVCSSQTSSKKSSPTSQMRCGSLLQNLEFDLDQLVKQLPEEECQRQLNVQPSTSVGPLCEQSPCPSSGGPSPLDASFVSAPSPSFSTSFPSPSNYSHSVDELALFEDQKLLDDPMLSSPSNWPVDHPNALSPFSDSFQREFFHMLE
ncbi:basic region leucine zipper [Ancylostoma caninum]|uniref:X-box-binding protein 1 n=1 Tax=Ancylostoma caninum TaxID=29170 RepID=A0A368H8G3_ANCCA|nr:basic region leucine zipper [Ancylostoma caninum]